MIDQIQVHVFALWTPLVPRQTEKTKKNEKNPAPDAILYGDRCEITTLVETLLIQEPLFIIKNHPVFRDGGR